VTDPKLAAHLKQHLTIGVHFKQSFIHSESEFIESRMADILKDTVERLPHNATFLTIMENTIDTDVSYKRPILLRDAMRKL
jgi:hypothetical protein